MPVCCSEIIIEESKTAVSYTHLVRTYLMELEKAGRLIRTHGGALLNDDILNVEESIAARKQKCLREKQKAAAKARSMIKDGDTILLDSGTTMLELAKLLKDAKNLTVVTNDLPSAMELQKDVYKRQP